MNLSKSKYCNGVQCKKMLWLEKNNPEAKEETNNQNVLDTGTEVGILAKKLFNNRIDIEFSEDLNKMLNDTRKALTNQNIVITEASFSYQNNFCSIDILKKTNDEYEIYEVKSSTEIKDIYLDDISYQTYVLLKLGLNVTKASIVYINKFYERKENLDLNKLFNIKDVTEIVMNKQSEVENNILKINNYMLQEIEPKDDIGIHCTKPYDCPFFKYCTKNLPINNIFNIKRMRSSNKFYLYSKGISSYEDLLKEDIDEKYKQQIEFELYNKKPSINKENINNFLETLSYPLYFLDFETYQLAVPKYEKTRPYEQIPFQYSLHYIESENGDLKHKEFLAEANTDCRRELALSLIKNIPKNVCVIAYNMQFEKMIIKNLAKLYPDLKEHLMNIHDDMHDLMIPFKNRDYYTKEMQGSYSIKYVLPALFKDDENLNYKNLKLIHKGDEASSYFINLGNYSLEEQKEIRECLLKYCELDTYAMVKIWEALNEVTEKIG